MNEKDIYIQFFNSILVELRNGIGSYELIIFVCVFSVLIKFEKFILILTEEIISLFSKKHKEFFLLNLEWYSPNYLLFRSDITNVVAKVRGLK